MAISVFSPAQNAPEQHLGRHAAPCARHTASPRLFRAGCGQKLIQRAPVIAQGGGKDAADGFLAAFSHQKIERLGQFCLIASAGEYFLPRFMEQAARRIVIQHGEAWRHARLDGKTRQHDLAEAVQGKDFQSAGRFQSLGEQPPRPGQIAGFAADGGR